jgi:DNA-binding protein YbaB
MPSPYEMMADQALAAYKKQRDGLIALQEKLDAVAVTVTAKRKVVSVTVGRQGKVTALSFPTGAYKNMVASELASIIMKTIEEATERAAQQFAALLVPVLPTRISADGIVRGTADLRALTDADPQPAVTAIGGVTEGVRE